MASTRLLRPTLARVRALTRRVLGNGSATALPHLPGGSPLSHYLMEGDATGRSPNVLFDPAWYRSQSPRLLPGDTALSHYVRSGDAEGLKPHPLFDPVWYRVQAPALAPSETALWHYLREGAAAGLSPHPLFDPGWYRAQVPELAAGENPLLHYLRSGESVGKTPHALFDVVWYRSQAPELASAENALVHYVKVGDRVGRSPNPCFDPVSYRWQRPGLEDDDNTLAHLVTTGFDVASYIAYLRQHPDLGKLGDNPLLQAVYRGRTPMAPFAPRSGDGPGRPMSRGNRLLRLRQSDVPEPRPARKGKADAERVLASVPVDLAVGAAERRIIVYTCCYGRYEGLKEPLILDPSVRFIAFTDDPNLKSQHWEVCLLSDQLSNARRTSRLPKLLPHLYLPDHDVSIYIDASLQWRAADVHKMIRECLEDREIGVYRHRRRDCVYEEIDVCEELQIEHREVIAFYRAHYEAMGLPKHAGLFELGLIVRRNTPAIRELNEAWWRIYLGQRDQLALLSALHATGVEVNAIKHGKQVRTNDYILFTKHERKALPIKKPKLYVFIAYAPPEYEQDLGRTYNEYMGLIEDDAHALFLDHDAMFCSPDWFRLVEQLVSGYDGEECLIVGRTNRVGNPYQRVGALADEHRVSVHARLAKYLLDTQRDWIANVSRLDSTSGTILMLSKRTWKQLPFSRGFLKVDNRMHIAFRESGRPVLMPASLYVYHFYRADGDLSHAVRLATPESSDRGVQALPPVIDETEHRLKNFVYDEAAGLDLAHYAAILRDDDWAMFLRADAMFCDKYWYGRAYARLSQLSPDSIVLMSNNLVDRASPADDDVLRHREYAAGRIGVSSLGPRDQTVSSDALVAFMISKRLLDRLVGAGGRSVDDLRRLLAEGGYPVLDDPSTHVFCLGGALKDALEHAAAEAPSTAALATRLSQNRRVAILTLGFWPSQAGMELMIHNLAVHLTRAGDLVTLYAPKPTKGFEEIPHNYLLKRFKSEQHFLEMFRRQHAVLPFDVLLVQGGLEAASMALILKRELGVPVVLRTHGEDIQVDESTGYGYRRDSAKRAVIDRNIREVDRNVVIGEHIRPLVKEIAPEASVTTIHNGVDVERFRPQPSRYLRDRLGLGDDRLILLTVGRNVKKKAFHLAVHALKRVVERVPEAVLVHVGKDGNGENLLEVAKALGVEHSFFRLGEVNYFETPLVYAGADLFVFPSKVETFGNVTVEALSSGLPCVEFDYSVNRQKIESGRNGYVVPFGDTDQLADRIIELLQDAEKRRAFSLSARRSAMQTFAWERVAERYRAIFREFRAAQTTRTRPMSGYGTAPLAAVAVQADQQKGSEGP